MARSGRAELGYDPGMTDDTVARRSLLTTALVGALLPKDVPEGQMVRAWLDSSRRRCGGREHEPTAGTLRGRVPPARLPDCVDSHGTPDPARHWATDGGGADARDRCGTGSPDRAPGLAGATAGELKQ